MELVHLDHFRKEPGQGRQRARLRRRSPDRLLLGAPAAGDRLVRIGDGHRGHRVARCARPAPHALAVCDRNRSPAREDPVKAGRRQWFGEFFHNRSESPSPAETRVIR
ncbi:hypothetical protein SGPA1_12350 [Streptomyces misionensis JCM 4497]